MTEQCFDLVVRNGTIVTPGHRERADVGITGGRIAQLGGTMTSAGEIDAAGLLVIPGGIDAHVHLMCAQFTAQAAAAAPGEPVWVDDFWTGSLAAIAGGITTVGNMTLAMPGETMIQAVARDMAGAAGEAAVDWFLHPVLTGLGDAELAEVAALAAGGHTSIKVFLSNPRFAAGAPGLAEVVAAAGRAGSMILMHCEDARMLEQAGRTLIEAGRGAVRYFPDARTVAAEVTAVEAAISLAADTGAAVYIVHLSSAAALDRCRQARAADLPIYVETRPLYLHLTRSRFTEPDAAKYVGAPPGVVTGRITLDQFVALTSAHAARLFGLHPRKGATAVGSDADLTLWDPGEQRVINGAAMASRAGYSVYDGWTVTGWPRYVLRRGQTVLADGQCTAQPGQGQWARRDPAPGPDVRP